MSQITTHILDTALGQPAAQVPVTLYHEDSDNWIVVGEGQTDSDGRVPDLFDRDGPLSKGNYKLQFGIQSYYAKTNQDAFYPFVEVVFKIKGDGQHYHVPLLLNPFGYSTYRGS